MTDHSRTGAAPLVLAITLLLFPIVYVSSYLALVQPQGKRAYDWSGKRVASYRINHHLASQIYYPLEKIDRKVRPSEWSQHQQKIKYLL